MFNDDNFLYIKFDLKHGFSLPNAFAVIDDVDSIVQTELVNNILIVKGLRSRFALNIGVDSLCIEKK
jgi:hypothetical protein